MVFPKAAEKIDKTTGKKIPDYFFIYISNVVFQFNRLKCV